MAPRHSLLLNNGLELLEDCSVKLTYTEEWFPRTKADSDFVQWPLSVLLCYFRLCHSGMFPDPVT